MYSYKLHFIIFTSILFPKIATECILIKIKSELICKNVQLTDVNNAISDKFGVKNIAIYDWKDTDLPNEGLGFSNLETLKIAGNLNTLLSDSLKNLINLERLDLSNNKIAYIPDDFFASLPKLKKLNLSHNNLTNLTLDTFYKLNNIELLNLSYNRISNIELGVLDEARTVKELILHHNALKSLQLGAFDELKELLTFDVSFNQITEVPLGVFDMPHNIQDLNLDGNKLNNLTLGIFDQLQNLSKLSISKNNLASLPLGVLDECKKVNEIKLSDNKLSNIPLGIFDPLTGLEIIILAGNNLLNIPKGLFDQNKKLIQIDLSRNHLQTLDGTIFENNEHLKHLNLSSNFFKDLDMNIFQRTRLDVLDISNNQFQTIKPGFINLESLQTIYAEKNEIDYLDPAAFTTTAYPLKHIDMRHNRMVFIEDDFFDWVANLKRFEISGNPWDCKCLEKILKQFVARNITYDTKYYFDGRKPVCVAASLFDCVVYRNKTKLYYEYYNKKT